MSLIVILPETHLDHPIPAARTIALGNAANQDEAIALFPAEAEVSKVVGSEKTAAHWWVAAHARYPKAAFYIAGQDALSFEPDSTPAPKKEAIKTAPVTSAQAPIVEKPKKTEDLDDPHKWPDHIFKLHAWGDPGAESKLQFYVEKAREISGKVPNLALNLGHAAKDGIKARELVGILRSKIAKGESQKELEGWIKDNQRKNGPRISRHLTIELGKKLKFHEKKRALIQENRGFQTSLPQVKLLENGIHPQNLRALKSSQQWEILVDEAGTKFEIDATALSESDKDLGRVVALLMPENHRLDECHIHATEASNQAIESVLAKIMASPCGILGATVKHDLKGYNWMAAVSQLVRWVLLMMPIKSDQLTRIKVLIENRSGYGTQTSLQAWQDSLVSELALIAPERFKGVHLSLEIMDKNYRYNGYVDTLAHCWGSMDAAKRKMLDRALWRDHCLLQTSNLERVEDLYRKLESRQEISSADWYTLCSQVGFESRYSLLKDVYDLLGARAKADAALWQHYLHEVLQRMVAKKFSTRDLDAAIIWLDRYRPEGQTLPKTVQLKLGAAQLAVANHLGTTDYDKAAELFDLAQALKDEDGPSACEAVLRVAVSATNSFDFNSITPYIEQWLAEPVGIPGLCNHAKLHSTLGQLAAFNGNYERALEYFDKALALFERLSNPEEKRRESMQTRVYRTIVLLDSGSHQADAEVRKILKEKTGKGGAEAIRCIARSGEPFRYEHALLLRWLVIKPENSHEMDEYLSCQNDWNSGEHHPWMLIDAWRAWLLVRASKMTDAADFMARAIEHCGEQPDSVVLCAMGHSLFALGKSLKLAINNPDFSLRASGFRQDALGLLENATNDSERITYMSMLLPFNFH